MIRAAPQRASDSPNEVSRASERRAGAPPSSENRHEFEARGERLIELENWSALLELELTEAHSGRAVRLAAAARRRLDAALPKSTYRGAFARLLLKFARKGRQGPRALIAAGSRRIWRTGPVARLRWAIALTRHRPKRPLAAPAGSIGVIGLVSVVLPVFNQADLLAESIESVLSQSYREIELIVIDDGSTDGVASVLEHYANDPRVRLLEQANLGLPKALSNGFTFAQGEFWTWTSADNVMEPDQLLKLTEFLRSRPDVGMVYANYRAIDEFGEPLRDPAFRPQNRRSAGCAEILLPRDARAINAVPDNFIGPCFLYRGAVGRMIGEYDPNPGVEDYDYWMRVNHAFAIEHLASDDVLYRYRVHGRSLSGRAGELRIADRVTDLMQYERERQAFFRQPWTIVFDGGIWNAAMMPGPRIAASIDLESAGETWAAATIGSVKRLYLVSSAKLETLARSSLPDRALVAVWFGSVDDVYERRADAQRLRIVAFAESAAVAERLELFGITVFLVSDARKVLELALRFGNNRSFYERTRPTEERARGLPVPSNFRGSPHVLMQLDDFDHGGLENVVLAVARGLRAREMKVSILVLGRQGPAAEQARAEGFAVLSVPGSGRERAYECLLLRESIDLVQAHYSTFGSAIAARLGVPFVQVVHNTYVWLDDESARWYRRADQDTTAIICVSAEVARYCDRGMGLSVSKMIVLPNGIERQRLDDAHDLPPRRLRDELGLGEHDFVFLNVASIHATKAQTVLVRAFADLAKVNERARLVMVGSASDPAYEARVLRLILRLGLGRKVIMAGQRADVARFYWMADAFVLPSFWEGWSLALTEAVYTGLPVVATDVGGARDLIAPGTGYLVEPPFRVTEGLPFHEVLESVGTEDERFVAELAKAMLMTCDSARRVSLSNQRKRMLDVECMVERHATVLAWLLQGGKPASARAWTSAAGEPTAGHDGAYQPRPCRTGRGRLRDVTEAG